MCQNWFPVVTGFPLLLNIYNFGYSVHTQSLKQRGELTVDQARCETGELSE